MACVAFLIGISLAQIRGMNDPGIWLLAAVPLVFTARKRTWWVLAWLLLFSISFGWWRGTAYMLKEAEYQDLFGQKTELLVRAKEDATYATNKQLSFTAGDVTLAASGQRLVGTIVVSGFGENAVFQGDEVRVVGKLFPSRGANSARISYAQLDVLAHHNSWVAELRRRFAAGMQSALPEPAASFAMGLLIGQRTTLPDEVKQNLLMVGLTHIIAVSGYNLTIILKASNNKLGKRSKRQALLLSVVLIGTFLLFTGSSASIVRASVISLLGLIAGYYGRSFKPMVLILLAAAITGFANPFYVWGDASWYLSFLAFYGVLVLAPQIQRRLAQRWTDSLLFSVALESLCAELVTIPFVLHTFGQMSFVGLIANVLVVALIPLAMLLACIAGLAGMLMPAIAGWFAWPASILLTYMLDTANLLSRVPHGFANNINVPVWQMLVLYAVIALISSVLWLKNTQKTGIITDRSEYQLKGA